MAEEVGEVCSAEAWSPPYLALSASLCLVRLQLAISKYPEWYDLSQVQFPRLWRQFPRTLGFATAYFLLSCGTLLYTDGRRELL